MPVLRRPRPPVKAIKRRWWLNTIGLFLGMVGVIIIFIWGPPQPNLDPQGSLLLEGGPDKAIEMQRGQYEIRSRVGLALIFLGFVVQIAGTLPPPRG